MSEPQIKEQQQEVRQRILKILEMMRPAIQLDGGDIEFVDFDAEGRVHIRLHGACVGCPSSHITLQMGIEKNLKEKIPQVTGVLAV